MKNGVQLIRGWGGVGIPHRYTHDHVDVLRVPAQGSLPPSCLKAKTASREAVRRKWGSRWTEIVQFYYESAEGCLELAGLYPLHLRRLGPKDRKLDWTWRRKELKRTNKLRKLKRSVLSTWACRLKTNFSSQAVVMVVLALTFNPSTWVGGGGRQVSEFKASQVYRESSKIARATQRNSCLEKPKPNQLNKQPKNKNKQQQNPKKNQQAFWGKRMMAQGKYLFFF